LAKKGRVCLYIDPALTLYYFFLLKTKQGGDMNEKISATAKRAGRVSLATLIGGAVAHFTGDPKWLAIAPVLSALGKFLRMTLGLNFIPF